MKRGKTILHFRFGESYPQRIDYPTERLCRDAYDELLTVPTLREIEIEGRPETLVVRPKERVDAA